MLGILTGFTNKQKYHLLIRTSKYHYRVAYNGSAPTIAIECYRRSAGWERVPEPSEDFVPTVADVEHRAIMFTELPTNNKEGAGQTHAPAIPTIRKKGADHLG